MSIKYRQKSEHVEAMQFTGGRDSADAIREWINQSNDGHVTWWFNHDHLGIPAPFGTDAAVPTNWVVSNKRGEFFVLSDVEFRKQYEPEPSISSVASGLALALMQEKLAQGHSIEIPSLGITIEPEEPTP